MDKTITVPESGTVGALGTVIRYLLTALGTLLATKQILPSDTDVPQLVGTILAVGSTIYGLYKQIKHHRERVVLATAVPDSIAKVT
jgi:hypothetical protein